MQEHAIVEHFLTTSKRFNNNRSNLLGPCGSRASLADPCKQWSFVVVAPIAVDVAGNCRTGVFVSRTTAVGLEGGVLARGVAGEQKRFSVPSLHSRVPRIPNKMGRFVPTALVSLPYSEDLQLEPEKVCELVHLYNKQERSILKQVHPSCHLFSISPMYASHLPQPPMQMRNPKSRTNNCQIKFGGLHGVPYLNGA